MINDNCPGFSLIEVLVVISLMALLAVLLGAKSDEMFTEDKFYKTCYMMEEIKEAIIGRPGHYCNGVQQFTGYVSDMGNLPNLYCFDDDKELVQVTHRAESGKIEATGGDGGASLLANTLKQGYRPQPRALWSKNIGDLPEWKYHADAQLWAGWRGPYIDPPLSGALRDAWGNPFLFVIGEVVGLKNEGRTYRCKQTYVSTREKLGRPGTSDGDKYWEVIDEEDEMNFRTWQDLGTAIVKDTDGNELEDYDIPESLQTKQEKFYAAGCLTVISLGADKEPGGEGLDKDISIVIDPTEYMGEVAGNVGNREELFADRVCLYYPNYTEKGGAVDELCIPEESGKMQDNFQLLEYEDPFNAGDLYTGINFRFGTATAMVIANTKWSCTCTEGGEDCYCGKYERLNYHCYIKNEDLAPDYPLCMLVYYDSWGCSRLLSDDPCICRAYGRDRGYPEICANQCVEAWCKEKVCCESLDSEAAENWDMELESVTCEAGEYDVCVEWICDEEMPDCDCTALSVSSEYDDPNWIKKNIPIGIRSLSADSGSYYMFPVSPGGNWIGTVKGE